MNKICKTCDTKNRLRLCNGKDENFKYCYRKSGNPEQTKDTIFQFNSIEELKNKLKEEDKYINENALKIDWNYDEYKGHIGLALCEYDYDLFVKTNGIDGGIIKGYSYPKGWIYF
jgi:hypothetical protein